jgi:hypothetical protein
LEKGSIWGTYETALAFQVAWMRKKTARKASGITAVTIPSTSLGKIPDMS